MPPPNRGETRSLEVTQSDLKDATLGRLNKILQFLGNKISEASGNLGPVKFLAQIQAPQATLSTAQVIKGIAANDLITKATADKLYGAATLKTALQTGVNPVTGDKTPPIQVTVPVPNLSGPHSSRVNGSVSQLGYTFWETDRTVLYEVQIVKELNAWVYLLGTMQGTTISADQRPIDLGPNDNGFLFYSTDALLTYTWIGGGWSLYNNYEPIPSDTHALRIDSTTYPAVRYAAGTQFFETDRGVTYISKPATGTVDTSGTAVHWISGPTFDPSWANQPITINAVVYRISSVTDSTHLVLTITAGTQAAVGFTVASGSWFYQCGQMTDVIANIPGDLTTNDVGFLFASSDFEHAYQWGGAAWDFAPGDPGSEWISAGIAFPKGGLWAICDGSTVITAQPNGTTANFVSPDLTGDIFLKGGTPGARQAAARSTWDAAAKTEDEALHIHPENITVGAGSIAAGTGATVSVVTSVTAGNTGPSTSPHHHGLTNSNANLNPPSEANGGLPLRIALSWYVRL